MVGKSLRIKVLTRLRFVWMVRAEQPNSRLLIAAPAIFYINEQVPPNLDAAFFSFPSINNSHPHAQHHQPSHHFNHITKTNPLTQNHQNDWRKVWRQGQRHQVGCAIVSSAFSIPFYSLSSQSIDFDAFFPSKTTRFTHTNLNEHSLTSQSQAFVQGRSRIPSWSCPPSSPKGQLRSACWCR